MGTGQVPLPGVMCPPTQHTHPVWARARESAASWGACSTAPQSPGPASPPRPALQLAQGQLQTPQQRLASRHPRPVLTSTSSRASTSMPCSASAASMPAASSSNLTAPSGTSSSSPLSSMAAGGAGRRSAACPSRAAHHRQQSALRPRLRPILPSKRGPEGLAARPAGRIPRSRRVPHTVSPVQSQQQGGPSGPAHPHSGAGSPATAAGSTCCVVASDAPRCMGAPPPVLCPLASMKAGRQATMAVARVGPGQAQADGSASYSSSSCRGRQRARGQARQSGDAEEMTRRVEQHGACGSEASGQQWQAMQRGRRSAISCRKITVGCLCSRSRGRQQ